MRRRSRAVVFSVLALVIIGALAYVVLYPPPPPPPRLLPLKIAVPTYLGYEPLYYAAKHGNHWANAGLALTLSHIDDVPFIAAGLAQNTINATMTTVDAAVQARSQGILARIILVTDRSRGADGVLATTRSGCRSLHDLRGKRVGLQLETASHYYLLSRLQQEHIDPGELKFVPLEPDHIGPAILHEDIDAAVTWHPFLFDISQQSGVIQIETTKTAPTVLLDGLFVTEASLHKDREAWQRFVKAWFEALEDIRKNPQPFYAFVAKKYQRKPDEIAALYGGIAFQDRDANVFYFSARRPESLDNTIDNISTVFRTADVIPRNVEADALMDSSLVIDHGTK